MMYSIFLAVVGLAAAGDSVPCELGSCPVHGAGLLQRSSDSEQASNAGAPRWDPHAQLGSGGSWKQGSAHSGTYSQNHGPAISDTNSPNHRMASWEGHSGENPILQLTKKHEGSLNHGSWKKASLHQGSAKWDPDLLKRPCLLKYLSTSNVSKDFACGDAPNNTVKDDKGNYIQFTRREDKFAYAAWYGALKDCMTGESYVRDTVASFAERTSCFTKGGAMMDEDWMYIPANILVKGKIQQNGTEKVLCVGDKYTANESQLVHQMNLLRGLVKQWDTTPSDESEKKKGICKEMLAAHTLPKYSFIGILHSTRPSACNTTSPYADAKLCNASEEYLRNFQKRDLFVTDVSKGGFKGRAAEGENERSERCKKEVLKGKPWYEHLMTNAGSTVEFCSIDTSAEEVFSKPILKVGVLHENMADNAVSDAYRFCGAPFVAGVSATMPQYLASAAAGPEKAGRAFETALDMKEAMTLMAMLELSGFHAVTSLTLSVNFYYQSTVVTPPFDSGDFDEPDDKGGIRCHDTETSCCTNSTKVDGFYNHKAWASMMTEWENQVRTAWPTEMVIEKSHAQGSSLGLLLSCGLVLLPMATFARLERSA